MPEILLFPFWLLAILGMFLLMVVTFTVLTVACVVEFVVGGPSARIIERETPEMLICEECGGQRSPYPRHRWQVVAYLRWLGQHAHPLTQRAFRGVGK